MKSKNIVIGSDHAGFELKEKIKVHLKENGYVTEDVGTFSTDSVDYPVIAKEVATKVLQNSEYRGILICGTGVGMSIVANKIKGIRAVVCSDTTSAKYSRLHNDTNILCFGQRIIGEYLAKDICDVWLHTDFEAERHLRRVKCFEN